MASTSAETSREKLIPIPRTGLRGASGVFLVLMLALACTVVGIGICAMRTDSPVEATIAEVLSAASCVLLIIHTWKIARRAKGMMPVLIVLAGFMAYLTNSFIPSAVLLGLICGMATGALALSIMTRKQALWAALVPAAAYILTLVCSRDPIGAVACLLPLPAAFALSVGTARSAEREDGPNRVGVICLTSLLLTLTLAGMVALTLYRLLGSLSPDTLAAALDTARETAVGWITSVELPADTTEELRQLFSREYAETVVNFTINLLPAYIIVAVNLMATVSQLLLHAALVSFGCGESLSERVRVFRMSAISCIVFAVAYLMYLITGGAGGSLAGTVAHNIYTVLIPGLAFSGLLRLISGMTKRRMGCLIFLLIFLLPLIFLVAPVALALVETIGRFIAFLTSRIRGDDDSAPGTPGD